MTLAAGTRLGPYEILAPLGAGGMGEVFRARDTRLGRDVAIKALPDAFALDPERLTRFEREARLLASLSHPNIAGILGLEEVEGRSYLVLEFVDGETLAARIVRGPLPVTDALQVCAQVAGAVESAHEAGVIHRDLKPGNVMLKPDGTVKVLDFGLAKAGATAGGSSSDQNLSASPTLTYAATVAGVILGTAAYMSPEQARGKPVDRRTDIWSLGCVLFECLTGRQCFAGETLSDTIAMILQRDPDWQALPTRTPLRIRQLLARCLERDAKKRLRDAGEARIALEASLAGLERGTEISSEPPGTPTRRGRMLALAAGVLAGAALALLAMRLLPAGRGRATPVVRYAIELPEPLTISTHPFMNSTLWDVSDDGLRVVVRVAAVPGATGPRLLWRRLSEGEWQPVAGSERAFQFQFPVFGRDGRTVYFGAQVSDETQDIRVMRVNLEDGGAAVPVCDLPRGAIGAWPMADGRIVFVHSDGRQIAVREPGAGTTPAWQAIDRGDYQGSVNESPMPFCPTLGSDELFVGTTLYASDGWHRGTALLNVRTRTLTPVLQDGQWPVLHPSGVLFFSQGSTILAARFDTRSRRVRGEPVPLVADVRTGGEWLPARFRITRHGDLFTSPGGSVGDRRSLEWVDRMGNATPYTHERRAYSSDPSGTTDGRRVVISATNARGFDEIWAFDGDDRSGQLVMRGDSVDLARPILSRDGRRLAHNLMGMDGRGELRVASYAGDRATRVLARFSGQDSVYFPVDWFPDGRHLLARLRSSFRNDHLAVFDVNPADTGLVRPRDILPHYDCGAAAISPDGRFLTFDSGRSGRSRVYVCEISPEGVTGAPVAVTRSGTFPAWIDQGARILYADSTVIRTVRISTAGGITASDDRVQFPLGERGFRIEGAATLSDGRSLMALRPEEGSLLSRLDVVQNWLSSVRSKLPK